MREKVCFYLELTRRLTENAWGVMLKLIGRLLELR